MRECWACRSNFIWIVYQLLNFKRPCRRPVHTLASIKTRMRRINYWKHMRVRDDGHKNSENCQFTSCTTTSIRRAVFFFYWDSVNNFLFWKEALIPLLIYPLFSLGKAVASAPVSQTTIGTLSVAAHGNRKFSILILWLYHTLKINVYFLLYNSLKISVD